MPSGRRPIKQEIKAWQATENLVNLSIGTLVKIQKSKALTLKEKGAFAVPIVTKHIKQSLEVSGGKDIVLQIVHYAKADALQVPASPIVLPDAPIDIDGQAGSPGHGVGS
jgi:hypothetical protein